MTILLMKFKHPPGEYRKSTAYFICMPVQPRKHGLVVIVRIGVGASQKSFTQNVEHFDMTPSNVRNGKSPLTVDPWLSNQPPLGKTRRHSGQISEKNG